jgi:hypothetical protein
MTELVESVPLVDSIWKCYNGRYYQVVGHCAERRMVNGVSKSETIVLSREVTIEGNPIAPHSGVHRRVSHAWNRKNRKGQQKYTLVEKPVCPI